MNARHNRIILVDHNIEMNSDWLEIMDFQKPDFINLNPKNLLAKIDWTRYEDDVQIINDIYSSLFEDVVMNNKTLICFWPLNQQFGTDWIELATLCKENSCKIEINKGCSFADDNYDLDETLLNSWKKFVYFLLMSLFEDIQLNKEFDPIGTLKSDSETIILFKWVREGSTRYSYAFDSDFLDIDSALSEYSEDGDSRFKSYGTFSDMLEKLFSENDLVSFFPQFGEKNLEKAYFCAFSKKIETMNLIESWLKTYYSN